MGNNMNTDDEKKGVKVSIDNPGYSKVADLSDGDIEEPVYIKPISTDTPEKHNRDKEMLREFLSDHGVDKSAADDIMNNLAEWRGMINYLSRQQRVHSGEKWVGCKCGEIYYLPDKDCYTLVVGVIENDKHMDGETWVATRTSSMHNPTPIEAWMGLTGDVDDDKSILFVRPDVQLRFGVNNIYNLFKDGIAKYLTGEPAYVMTDEEWRKADARIYEYESGQAGEC